MDNLSKLFTTLCTALADEPDTNVRMAALRALVAATESQQQVEYTSMLMRDQLSGNGGGFSS